MDISLLDLLLFNLVSFCGGAFSTFIFVFCCEGYRFERIADKSYLDSAMNHQTWNSPVLASAPPPDTFTEITQKRASAVKAILERG
jgi:hypothetical protein